jgi:MYXO-CTERM domain-containing protein
MSSLSKIGFLFALLSSSSAWANDPPDYYAESEAVQEGQDIVFAIGIPDGWWETNGSHYGDVIRITDDDWNAPIVVEPHYLLEQGTGSRSDGIEWFEFTDTCIVPGDYAYVWGFIREGDTGEEARLVYAYPNAIAFVDVVGFDPDESIDESCSVSTAEGGKGSGAAGCSCSVRRAPPLRGLLLAVLMATVGFITGRRRA